MQGQMTQDGGCISQTFPSMQGRPPTIPPKPPTPPCMWTKYSQRNPMYGPFSKRQNICQKKVAFYQLSFALGPRYLDILYISKQLLRSTFLERPFF